MSALGRGDAPTFDDFFESATDFPPHDYQQRLAEGLAGGFPDLLDVPTGLGKTAAAVLAWLWRRRFHERPAVRAETPRRLVYCLPMRVLVEQTYAEAIRWLDALGMLAGNASWQDPGQRKELQRYDAQPEATVLAAHAWAHRHGDEGFPIAVHILMGGEDRTDWVLWPERDAILIGTQDMLLSRALNRGYAAGRARWPMEFGLLNNDCLWVFDEIQLMGSGLATSLQLQAWRDTLRLRQTKHGFPKESCQPVFGPTRSLWMSATMAKHWLEKAVDWQPKAQKGWERRERVRKNEKLAGYVGDLFKVKKHLLQDRNPVASLKAPATKEGKVEKGDAARQTREYLTSLAGRIVANRSHDGATLVIVNTVERATGLYELVKAQEKRTVHLIHSRFRPCERQSWNRLLSKENRETRIIISTQVVEAGVDFSAHVLFTELAPWASLVQRFGRCARYRGETGTIYWMDLPQDSVFARPYEGADLRAAREQLRRLEDAGLRTLSNLSLDADMKKALFPYDPKFVPRDKDLFDLFDTTPDLTGADIDISRFIRDGLELDVMVYWRDIPTGQQLSAKERPHRDELCPVPFNRLREQLAALRKHGKIWRRHYRKGWEEISGENSETIYAGQVFLLEAKCGGYSQDRGWTGDPDDLVTPVTFPPDVAAEPSNEQEADNEEGSDSQCESRQWLTIAQHSHNVRRLLDEGSLRDVQIAQAVGDHAKVLRLAARWHDRGKAHPAFQAKLKSPDEAQQRLNGQPAAKAPAGAWRHGGIPEDGEDRRRPGFRHELASALGALETLWRAQPDHAAFAWPNGLQEQFDRVLSAPSDGFRDNQLAQELASLSADVLDLFVYLVAAHHGKVRMSLRASPDDTRADPDLPDPCPGETAQARGVREGDDLPACALPDASGLEQVVPAVKLCLDPMALGLSTRYGPSWRERTQALLECLGPFRLAYLEALLRAADWRASREERQQPSSSQGEGTVQEPPETYSQQREAARAFVQRWAEAGPALEEQRCRELQELDDETARRMTLDLFRLWRPSEFDDLGAGLVEQQKVFARLRQREAEEAKSR